MPRNDSIEKVLNEYKIRKAVFDVKRDELLQRLYEKYPDLYNNRKEYAALRANERKHKGDENYKNQYAVLDEKYNELLDKCLKLENIPPEELIYKPLCDICLDTGYVGDSQKRFCSCVISKAAQNVLNSSNINDRETLHNSDFDIFDDAQKLLGEMTQKQIMQKLYDYIKSWTEAFPANEKKQIMMIGNVGLGKSYLMNAVAYDVINKGHTVMLVSSFAINEAAFDEIKHSDATALNMMRNVDLLLIDDLGGEQVLKNITCPTLLNILNERTRKNLSTIISTNLNRDMLEEKYDTRVVSRMFDKARTFVPPILGRDIRKKHND